MNKPQYHFERCYCETCGKKQETRTYYQITDTQLANGHYYNKTKVWDCLECTNTWSEIIERKTTPN